MAYHIATKAIEITSESIICISINLVKRLHKRTFNTYKNINIAREATCLQYL